MLNKQDWFHQGSWGTPFLIVWLDAAASSKKNAESYGYRGYDCVLILQRDPFIPRKDYNEIGRWMREKATKEGAAFFNRLKTLSENNNRRLLALAEKIRQKDLSKLTNEQLGKLFSEFAELVKPCTCFATFLQPMEDVLLGLLREKLQSYAEEEGAVFESLVAHLTPPKRMAAIGKERRERVFTARAEMGCSVD